MSTSTGAVCVRSGRAPPLGGPPWVAVCTRPRIPLLPAMNVYARQRLIFDWPIPTCGMYALFGAASKHPDDESLIQIQAHPRQIHRRHAHLRRCRTHQAPCLPSFHQEPPIQITLLIDLDLNTFLVNRRFCLVSPISRRKTVLVGAPLAFLIKARMCRSQRMA